MPFDQGKCRSISGGPRPLALLASARHRQDRISRKSLQTWGITVLYIISQLICPLQALGFQTISGEAKLRLLPTPWPMENMPAPTASLLSIASNKGLLAAAGPDSIVVASTDSIRQTFLSNEGGNLKPFAPQLTLNIGMRVSHVAFSADESYLVISAEQGGGLAVFDVQGLAQGNTQPAFEVSTNGSSLCALVPNPAPDRAELFALITTNGELMIANLKNSQPSASGRLTQVLKEGVTCVSWSTRGKQLVAGLKDGTSFQLTPEGEGKAQIPRPGDLIGDQHGEYEFSRT